MTRKKENNAMDERAFEQRVLELEPRLYRTACAILSSEASGTGRSE